MGNILVMYFSVTGHTKLVAETVAEVLGCELKRIEPAKPYDFDNPLSIIRSVVEQIVPCAQPQLKDGRVDMTSYDIVMLAEPIWLGKMPKAVKAFIEANDFADKAVFNLCTGGTDDGEGNLRELEKMLPSSTAIAGVVKFDEDVTREDVLAWLKGF